MSRRRSWLGLCVLLPLTVAACGSDMASKQPAMERPLVVVSVVPQKYVVDRIAGELVDVEVLIPPGVSPATHAPSVAQIQAV